MSDESREPPTAAPAPPPATPLPAPPPAVPIRPEKHFLDYAAAIFAFVAAIGAISSVVVGYWQWDVYSGQLSVMRAEHRAWVKADPIIDTDFIPIKDFLSAFGFHFDLTNVGHAPALNVRTLALLYSQQSENEDLRTVWKEKCKAFEAESDIEKASGFVLLPGETAPSNKDTLSSPGLSIEMIRKTLSLKPNGGGNIQVSIIGCVDYLIEGDKKHHQTGIFYSLWNQNKENGAWNFGINPKERIAARDIHLVAIHFASDMTN
jgi:hypothetical protein